MKRLTSTERAELIAKAPPVFNKEILLSQFITVLGALSLFVCLVCYVLPLAIGLIVTAAFHPMGLQAIVEAQLVWPMIQTIAVAITSFIVAMLMLHAGNIMMSDIKEEVDKLPVYEDEDGEEYEDEDGEEYEDEDGEEYEDGKIELS